MEKVIFVIFIVLVITLIIGIMVDAYKGYQRKKYNELLQEQNALLKGHNKALYEILDVSRELIEKLTMKRGNQNE